MIRPHRVLAVTVLPEGEGAVAGCSHEVRIGTYGVEVGGPYQEA